MSNQWYVITGGPSSGKTTVLAELAKRGHKTVPEAARTVIDEAMAKGISPERLRADEKRFQEDVAKLKEKIESELDDNVLTFFDRGMHDTLAYLRHYGFEVEKWIDKLLRQATYGRVFLLDPLPVFQKDYARTEDKNFPPQIHKLLHEAYAEFGMKPVRVKVASPKARAKFILSYLKKEQSA